MANKSIFCNLPWQGVRIYSDGSYGICCAEKHKLYSNDLVNSYNLSSMTINEWYNSDPVKQLRMQILSDTPLALCVSCYNFESVGNESMRIKHNIKSAIFPQSFDRSYKQSPWFNKFESSRTQGITDLTPIYWHVDLGNECNLACKMCSDRNSSKIAATLQRHGLSTKFQQAKYSWTSNNQMWSNFLKSIEQSPKLHALHIRGGEPTLMRKFLDLIDYLIEIDRTDISLSFATNGTLIKGDLANKLLKFKDVDIEVSIETIDSSNDYIRQGSNINQVKQNIETFINNSHDGIQLTLQSTIQALSITRYIDLLRFAWQNQLVIEGKAIYNPRYMTVDVLPREFRLQFIQSFRDLANEVAEQIQHKVITVGRMDVADRILTECNSAIQLLELPENEQAVQLRSALVQRCEFWDKEYKMNIKDYIPELHDLFTSWGYNV